MSDEAQGDEFDSDLDPPKKFAGKKLVLFVVLPILLLGGSGAALIMGGFLDSKDAEGTDVVEKSEEIKPATPRTVFYDLPVLLVNLNTSSRRPSFLKITVSLELENSDDISRIDTLQSSSSRCRTRCSRAAAVSFSPTRWSFACSRKNISSYW